MPPLPRIRTPALADLANQLRFVPPGTLRRQVARAEDLAGEIDPAGSYPEDWVVFRVTGYRAEVTAPAVLTGAALVSDLSAFVERLSASAPESWNDLTPGAFLDADALGARWNVSRKTLDRCRRRGLIAHRVLGENGRARLAFPLRSVERFESRHRDELGRAASFSRISRALESSMVRRAGVYRRRLGCTLNQAAARLAERYGRSHEAVRQVLRRADARAPARTFTEPPPPTAHDRRLIERASRLAIEPAAIAERLGRATPGVRRVITDQRAARLRALGLPGPVGEKPGRDAGAGPREHPGVRGALGAPGATDLLAFVETARERGAPDAEAERARCAAHRSLMVGAGAITAALPEHGAPASRVDEAETLLRWAARLRVELVRDQLPVLVRSLEAAAGRGLEEVRSAVLVPLIDQAIAAASEAVDGFDPSRSGRGGGGRLAAPTGLAVTRVATRFVKEHTRDFGPPVGARATPRLHTGVPLPDWTRRVAPWQVFLEPDPRVRAALPALDEPSRRLLVLRYGWDGPPLTLPQLAAALDTTIMKAAMKERSALRAARRIGGP